MPRHRWPWQSALVTGGSRGIGHALATVLVAGGTRVYVTGSHPDSLVLAARRSGAEPLLLDAGDTARSVAVIRDLDQQVDGLDLVIANAGVGAPAPDAVPYAWETLSAAFHVNFCGAAATLTAALPAMVARGRGHLVGIGSLASFGPLPQAAAYCAPKAGLAMLLACLRLDLARTGVSVTTVNLGFVRTRMTARSTHPMPQVREPEEIAAALVPRLVNRPRSITLPRALGLAARAGSLLPERWKAARRP